MTLTHYEPKEWTKEELEKKNFWISNQGLFVTENVNCLCTYITFLDQSCLSQYKADVYEEEMVMRAYDKLGTITDEREKQAFFNQMLRVPNIKTIMERYIRRRTTMEGEELEDCIKLGMEYWDRIVKSSDKLDILWAKRNKAKSFEDKSLYLNKDTLNLF